MSDVDHEKGQGDIAPHPMKETDFSEDELAANIQVAGPIPLASWLIIVSKYYRTNKLFQRHAATY